MADPITPGITSDDAAIYSLNTPDDGQSEDPFKDGRAGIPGASTIRHQIKSGSFGTDKPLFNLTPGAKRTKWCDNP